MHYGPHEICIVFYHSQRQREMGVCCKSAQRQPAIFCLLKCKEVPLNKLGFLQALDYAVIDAILKDLLAFVEENSIA